MVIINFIFNINHKCFNCFGIDYNMGTIAGQCIVSCYVLLLITILYYKYTDNKSVQSIWSSCSLCVSE